MQTRVVKVTYTYTVTDRVRTGKANSSCEGEFEVGRLGEGEYSDFKLHFFNSAHILWQRHPDICTICSTLTSATHKEIMSYGWMNIGINREMDGWKIR